jgi:hypothetical protein
MDSSFVDHEEEIPTMNTYSCDSCGKTYKALANLRRHLDDTHSEKLFQCETYIWPPPLLKIENW